MTRGSEEWTSLLSLVPKEWFARLEDSSVWLRMYTSLGTPPRDLPRVIDALVGKSTSSPTLMCFMGQVLFAGGLVKGMTVPAGKLNFRSVESGQVELLGDIHARALPETGYIMLGVPYRRDGTPGDEVETRARLNTAVGLLALQLGRNFMWECVFDGELNGADGSFTASTAGSKVPKPTDGPYLDVSNGAELAEISSAIATLPEPKQARVRLALQLAESAVRADSALLDYFVALEVLCDGRGSKITQGLAKAYRVKDDQKFRSECGLDVLTQWRGDLVHKGLRHVLTADVERYLQLMLLDLLRYELGLGCRQHSAAMRMAVGVDLSSIGLADNRRHSTGD